MKLLILGGTLFLGRHLVEAALSRGHEVTLFNRGLTNPGLFQGVETIHGDRTKDLALLAGRRWDAAIDTAAYLPRDAESAALALASSVERYCFVSTISVYASLSRSGMDESAALAELPAGARDDEVGEHYGALKVRCERAVETAIPGRTLITRPGLIVGPHDPTDRFSYWPWRLAHGGEVLAPGVPQSLVQVIDARDLAAWTVLLLERGAVGIFNATAPSGGLPFGDVLAACTPAGTAARLTWIPRDFLATAGVAPWSELPLYLPDDEATLGMLSVSVARAFEHGLAPRPIAETAADTVAWLRTLPADRAWKAGLRRERERELLAAWHTRP